MNGNESKNGSNESKYKSPKSANSKQNGTHDQYGTLMPDQLKNMNLKNDNTLKSNATRKLLFGSIVFIHEMHEIFSNTKITEIKHVGFLFSK